MTPTTNPTTNPTDRLLTTEQAAELLVVHVDTLKVWRRQGRGPAWVALTPRTIRYLEADIHGYIEQTRQRTA